MSERHDNKLKKIHDSKQIGHQLLSAKEKGEQIFVWRFVGDKKVMVQVTIDVVKKASLELLISPLPHTAADLRGILGGSDHLNFFLPASSLLFQSPLKQADARGQVTLAFPSFLAQVERRKWLRMRCTGQSGVRTQFSKTIHAPAPSKQFYGKPLYDLSAGGLTFLVSRQESKFFIPGEKIRNLEVLVRNEKIVVTGDVLRVQELPASEPSGSGGKLLKVTIAFEAVQKRDQEFLARYVFEHISLDEKAV